MRALFYHSARTWSGEARAFAAAARGLHARGHQVTFVCTPESVVEQRVTGQGFEVIAIRTDAGWWRTAWRLRRALAGRFVEAVFVQSEEEQLIAAAAARLAERSAIIRRLGSGEVAVITRRGRFASRLAAAGFLVASEEELRSAPADGYVRLEPLVAMPGVNTPLYDSVRPVPRPTIGAGAASTLIASVYDRTARLRAATMLRAIHLLAPLHPELRLAIVGPGSDDEDLRMHAAALGLTKLVSFLGERDDQLAVLRAADLGWVVASGDEAAFGCLDVGALRIPVLAERGPLAQTYVADGITGLLLPPDDANATAAAVARLLAHADQRAAMGAAARTRIGREFTEEAMVDGFERAAAAASDRSRWQR